MPATKYSEKIKELKRLSGSDRFTDSISDLIASGNALTGGGKSLSTSDDSDFYTWDDDGKNCYHFIKGQKGAYQAKMVSFDNVAADIAGRNGVRLELPQKEEWWEKLGAFFGFKSQKVKRNENIKKFNALMNKNKLADVLADRKGKNKKTLRWLDQNFASAMEKAPEEAKTVYLATGYLPGQGPNATAEGKQQKKDELRRICDFTKETNTKIETLMDRMFHSFEEEDQREKNALTIITIGQHYADQLDAMIVNKQKPEDVQGMTEQLDALLQFKPNRLKQICNSMFIPASIGEFKRTVKKEEIAAQEQQKKNEKLKFEQDLHTQIDEGKAKLEEEGRFLKGDLPDLKHITFSIDHKPEAKKFYPPTVK